MTVQNSEFNPDSSRIHLLPEHLVDQIKAGEVIERPASLIKEILENSIDAKSTKIDLHIINNGMDLISLIDNGQGMTFHELPFAFCRHATSKIERFEDLYHLNSYGFRGEALASIAAVSRVTCTSSPDENSPDGGKIIYHGGECLAHDQQANLPQGTALFIKDLFYNTPARLKFVKSVQSEKNAIKRMVEASLLANPHITFSIKWDEQDKNFFPATADQQDRVAQVLLPKSKDKSLYTIDAEYEGHRVRGYFSQSSSRGNAYKRQYLFANQRIFTDRQIHQTIIRNLEKLYPHGESGHYCVFIDVPENLIDVNVHPNKTQIKFFKLPVITALLSSEIKKIQGIHDLYEQTGFDNLMTEESANHNFENHSAPSSLSNQIFEGSSLKGNHYKPRNPYGAGYTGSTTPTSIHSFTEKSHPDLIIVPAEEENSYQMVSLHRFWVHALERISKMAIEPDKDFIPLLISEPFSCGQLEKEQECLQALEERGLLCERVDERTMAVRAIYQELDPLDAPAELASEILQGSGADFSSFTMPWSRIERMAKTLELDRSFYSTPLDEIFYAKNFSNKIP